MATEKELRTEIRKHVRKMLAESNGNSFIKNVGSQVRASLGGGRTMLDKALGGMDVERLAKLPRMQKVGLLAALMQAFGITAYDLTALRGQVVRGMKAVEPVEEAKLNELEFSSGSDSEASTDSKLTGALASKGEKVEKTQAYKMLVKAIENKPALQQAEYVFDMLSKLPLDDAAKTKIRMKVKSELK
jgi:hypothetical protein